MIFIDDKNDNITNASIIHVSELSKLLRARIKGLKFSAYQRKFIEDEIAPKLETILGEKPATIKRVSEKLKLSGKKLEAIKKLVNYDSWFIVKNEKRYSAYTLAQNLDINTCVYCNRNYTSTVDKITRPCFDHYFPKNSYPLLALSFYNLIPSCTICNSHIKGKRELDLKIHLHPYIDNTINLFQFSYGYDTALKDSIYTKIKFSKKNSKVEKTFDFFKMKEVYNAHTDELRDLIKLRDGFSDKYLEILAKTVLRGTYIGRNELYQLAFGVYLDDSKVSRRPFSKFKKDILTELGII